MPIDFFDTMDMKVWTTCAVVYAATCVEIKLTEKRDGIKCIILAAFPPNRLNTH